MIRLGIEPQSPRPLANILLTRPMGGGVVSKVKLATVVEGDPNAPFSIATTPMCSEGAILFPELPPFTLDTYLILLCVKQGGIKHHLKILWYDTTWD